MTRYLLYFLTGFAVATIILFFRGYAGVPHSDLSNAALVGAMVLFGIASWLTLFNVKGGTLLALLSMLTMLPWVISAWMRMSGLEAAIAKVVLVVHAVLSGLVLLSLVTSLRYIFSRHSWRVGTATPGLILKILLSLIPLAVLVAWFVVEPKL